MTEDLVEGALTTKSVIHYSGNDVNVDSSDLNVESKQIEADKK